MKIYSHIIAIAAAALLMLSCAEATTSDYSLKEQAAFKKWRENNIPTATELIDGTGIYFELKSDNSDDNSRTPKAGEYIKINYTIKTLSGNVVYTRDGEVAQWQGTDSPYTYYRPNYIEVTETAEESSVVEALYYALANITEGQVMTVYTPSWYINGSQGYSNSIGYGGQYSLSANKPAIIDDIEIVEIIEDPEIYEQEMVEKVAFSHKPVGWDLSDDDILMENYYRDFIKRGYRERDGVMELDTIKVDSSARIYWKASFLEWNDKGELEGYLFDTNIDTVWINNFETIRINSNNGLVDDTTALRITRREPAEISSSMPEKVFSYLFTEEDDSKFLCYGDSIRIVVTSPYAYGTTGRSGYTQVTSSTATSTYIRTEIKPYTPIMYEFVVMRLAGHTGEEDEEEESED